MSANHLRMTLNATQCAHHSGRATTTLPSQGISIQGLSLRDVNCSGARFCREASGSRWAVRWGGEEWGGTLPYLALAAARRAFTSPSCSRRGG